MAFDPNFGKSGFARRLFQLRFRTLRISQGTFADRFGLTFGAVKDLEQGRTEPTRAMLLLVAAIERDPGMMANIAEQERAALTSRRVNGHRWRTNDGASAIMLPLKEAA